MTIQIRKLTLGLLTLTLFSIFSQCFPAQPSPDTSAKNDLFTKNTKIALNAFGASAFGIATIIFSLNSMLVIGRLSLALLIPVMIALPSTLMTFGSYKLTKFFAKRTMDNIEDLREART